MAVRQTGFALVCAGNIQEIMDLALVSQSATLQSRVPFLNFFDGFRSSHEVQKVEELTKDDMRAMIDEKLVAQVKARGLSPDRPQICGTAQNPDVYFQGREAVNKFYLAVPDIYQKTMDKFAALAGRQYHLFDYVGHPSGRENYHNYGFWRPIPTHETVDYLNSKGQKVGVVKVRLFRPFNVKAFINALPATVQKIAVLDRTKESGSIGEPLYLDVRTAIGEAMGFGFAPFKKYPLIVGGRYGLGSKEFTPAMVKAVFDNLDASAAEKQFLPSASSMTLPIRASMSMSPLISTAEGVYSAMFWGLGSDGTVGANKNSIKIIGEETDNFAQGYFVYDSKKAGAVTISHLRFGKDLIRKPYLVTKADFVACHNPSFLEKYDMLSDAKVGSNFPADDYARAG